ncbi:MAG TPA: biotin/lipoate A/B protein ligase family protein [Rectinemataceae bacterium]|nr:biotin/lipoate A/B protein ligase family protein [Rectinemataceae bacterium]
MTIRFVDTGYSPGSLNMGIDEAVLHAVSEGRSPPTLRFYGWKPECVTVGYFQSMDDEVDRAACAAAGVDAVRRMTGGGAVYHAEEITYSLVLPEGHVLAPADILESYRRICAGLVAGLGILGLDASFAPINDIVLGRGEGARKVSGNAQTRKLGCLLQHGTVLLGVEPERMFSLLKVPSEKLKGKLIQDVKARVVGLREACGRDIGYDEAAAALREGFSEHWNSSYGLAIAAGSLGEDEWAAGRRAAEATYSRSEWNLRR